MSQRNQKTKEKNNLIIKPVRRVNACSLGVFRGARTQPVSETVLLYRLVFVSRKTVLLSLLLCLCFLSQPFQNAYANEQNDAPAVIEIAPPTPPEIVETIAPQPELQPEDMAPEESPPETIPPPAEESPPETLDTDHVASDETHNDPDQEPATTTVGNVVVSVESNDIDIQADDTNAVIEARETGGADEDTDHATTTGEEIGVDDDSVSTGTSDSGLGERTSSVGIGSDDTDVADDSPAVSTSTDEQQASTTLSSANGEETANDKTVSAVPDLANEETVTDEADVASDTGELVSIVQSDAAFAFTRNECTRIEDGSFYCQKNEGVTMAEDSLIAAPDADGDLEIYLVRDGVRTQITHNVVDDASPYYDEYSKTIVWHRLINDRYQIISYDVKTGEEEQLTNTSVNNMQPTRHGDYTVWQRWVDNNWEIVLYDGHNEKQITDSPRHDIAPHIRGPLVIWNSRSNDGTQSLMTYDIKDRTYTTIADGEGVSVANPRMIVMYEATYENGDIIMKGFDLVSGEIIPLQSIPKQLPDDLPETDSTGETRALIQSKPTPKQTDVVGDESTSGSSTPPIIPDIDDGTLDLRPSTTPDIVIDEIVEGAATSSIPDLVVPPADEATSMSTDAGSAQTGA